MLVSKLRHKHNPDFQYKNSHSLQLTVLLLLLYPRLLQTRNLPVLFRNTDRFLRDQHFMHTELPSFGVCLLFNEP